MSESTNNTNILILSFGFMLLMAAWLTTTSIEPTILESVQVDNVNFTGNGYTSQSIINVFYSITNFIAPAIIAVLGERKTLFIATCLYTFFILNFLYPNVWLLYISSACVGFGGANLWVANGIYFTRCTTEKNRGKFVGIHWTIMALGQLGGSSFVFWKFQGLRHIDESTRFQVIGILTSSAILAGITLLFLRAPKNEINPQQIGIEGKNIFKYVRNTIKLSANKHMLLLIPTAMYNGLETAYLTCIYPTSLGFTEAFGSDSRKLEGIAGILMAVGSIIGGVASGLLMHKCKFIKSKRFIMVVFSCLIHITSSVLIYINIPNDASLHPTMETSWLNPPSFKVAMFVAFLLGLGDGCITPQMYTTIGAIWPKDPSPAFALYIFFLTATRAGAFFLGTQIGLHIQILIFVVTSLVGTITFIANEVLITKLNKYSAHTHIDARVDKQEDIAVESVEKQFQEIELQ